ncbi:MAG: hypothetical protein ACWGMZ_11815 [Thermoguttaceae bacterium]
MIKPVLQALVLADHIYQDKVTGKMIIAGTFKQLLFSKPTERSAEKAQAPAPSAEGQRKLTWHEVRRFGSPHVYISLTDVHDLVPMELRYIDLADNKTLLATQFTVNCNNPLETVEFALVMPPLPIPHAGVYLLELLSNNEPIGSLRITAVDISAQEKGGADQADQPC